MKECVFLLYGIFDRQCDLFTTQITVLEEPKVQGEHTEIAK